MTHELASTTKAWTTLRGREVVSLGRELLGGNGVVADFLVSPALVLLLSCRPKAKGHRGVVLHACTYIVGPCTQYHAMTSAHLC